MKYNILDFNQEKVLSLHKVVENKKGKSIVLKLDIVDLQILQVIADFMNRTNIIKYTIDDKTYFSIQYKVIIDDLPILDIKQQALSDRLNKMVELGVIEKQVIKNQSGSYTAFRMGENYINLKYVGKCSETQPQECSTTSAEVVDYRPKDYSTNNSSTNTNKEKEDKSSSKKIAKLNWRSDYETYKSEVNKAKELLLADEEYKKELSVLYPNIDYYRTIIKLSLFWESERGWEYKKKSQSNNINMASTLKRNADKNIVYSNRNNIPIENEKLLEMQILNEDGDLGDGTFFKNGYRWYYSKKERKAVTINIKASPMPNEDWEYDNIKNIWYPPKDSEQKNKVADMLW
jgi:hypothetical protein